MKIHLLVFVLALFGFLEGVALADAGASTAYATATCPVGYEQVYYDGASGGITCVQSGSVSEPCACMSGYTQIIDPSTGVVGCTPSNPMMLAPPYVLSCANPQPSSLPTPHVSPSPVPGSAFNCKVNVRNEIFYLDGQQYESKRASVDCFDPFGIKVVENQGLRGTQWYKQLDGLRLMVDVEAIEEKVCDKLYYIAGRASGVQPTYQFADGGSFISATTWQSSDGKLKLEYAVGKLNCWPEEQPATVEGTGSGGSSGQQCACYGGTVPLNSVCNPPPMVLAPSYLCTTPIQYSGTGQCAAGTYQISATQCMCAYPNAVSSIVPMGQQCLYIMSTGDGTTNDGGSTNDDDGWDDVPVDQTWIECPDGSLVVEGHSCPVIPVSETSGSTSTSTTSSGSSTPLVWFYDEDY